MTTVQSEENRISVADGLRGFAIIAITLIHSINHFNLSIFPESSSSISNWTDPIINTIVTSVSSGKSYGLFALLFGLTFYLQLSNQEKRGLDFKYRFIWRMFILFIIGTINSAFFAGEILVLYSILGLILVPLRHAKNRTLIIISILFLMQPLLLAKIVYILFNENYTQHFQRYSPHELFSELAHNSFIDMIRANLTLGRQVYWLSIISNGERIFQSLGLFIIGLLLGRKRLFEQSSRTNNFWRETRIVALISYLVVSVVKYQLTRIIPSGALHNMIDNLLSLWSDFTIIIFITGLFILIYSYSLKKIARWMEPIGKMSLTNYIMQSVLGSFIFYGYGLFLSKYCGITSSFLIGLILLFLQYLFCIWWLKHHKKGPIEQLWHNLTWIKKFRFA